MKRNTQPDYVTRDEFRTVLKNEFAAFEEKMDRKFEEQRIQITSAIFTKLDKIMKIIEELRDENTIGSYQTRELRENVDDHDLPAIALRRQLQAGKRIVHLEKAAKVS